MKWILIIIAFAGRWDGGVHVRTVEFSSQQTCEAAQVAIQKLRTHGDVHAICAQQ
jgi:hypothetical protein